MCMQSVSMLWWWINGRGVWHYLPHQLFFSLTICASHCLCLSLSFSLTVFLGHCLARSVSCSLTTSVSHCLARSHIFLAHYLYFSRPCSLAYLSRSLCMSDTIPVSHCVCLTLSFSFSVSISHRLCFSSSTSLAISLSPSLSPNQLCHCEV